ncbi:MAG: hypothetical protein AAF231_01655 [Pseudomonadota bacterium]
MKKLLTAAAFLAIMVGTAYASGVTEPFMEPEVIAADTSANANQLMIIAALAVMAILLGAAGAFG